MLELNLIQSFNSIQEVVIDVEYLHLFANLDHLSSRSLNASKWAAKFEITKLVRKHYEGLFYSFVCLVCLPLKN